MSTNSLIALVIIFLFAGFLFFYRLFGRADAREIFVGNRIEDDLSWLEAPEHEVLKIKLMPLIPGDPPKRRGAKRVTRRFETRIAGLDYANRDGSDRHEILSTCKIGEDVNLVREPNNSHDENAIMVVRKNGQQLGYLRREVAKRLVTQVKVADLLGAEIAEYDGANALLRVVLVPYERAQSIVDAGGKLDQMDA